MQTVRIGVSGTIDDIFDVLSKGFSHDRNCEIAVSVAEKNNLMGNTEIVFHSKKPGGISESTIKSLSGQLTGYIIDRYEKILLKKIINDNYAYLADEEKDELLNLSAEKLNSPEGEIYSDRTRARLINSKMEDYLRSTDSIYLDGFVKFRLQEYAMCLEEYVDTAADEYMAKREYNEFIKLLRYFVDMQKACYPKVHILAGEDGFYGVLDDKKRDITLECAREFISELADGANFDDILISSLITMAPKKIILHGSQYFTNSELLETIKSVFPGRLIICGKCEICDKIH